MKSSTKTTLIVLITGAFFALLNNAFLNVALAEIMHDLSISESTVQWMTTGYMLVNAILVPTTAFLMKKYSLRNLFLMSIGSFFIGSLLAGVAGSFGLLLTGRLIQGVGSALLMPMGTFYLMTSFPKEKRGSMMGLFGIVIMFAPAIGPTLSGFLIEHYSWNVLFLIMVPIMGIVWLIGYFSLDKTKPSYSGKIDTLSVFFSAFAFSGILYGFSSAGNKGWGDTFVWLPIVLGCVFLALLIIRQFRLDDPMLDFGIYKSPQYALASAITATNIIAMYSAMILIPLFLQNTQGLGAMETGLILLPGAILNGIMSPIAGRLFDKIGAKTLVLIGVMITIGTTIAFAQLDENTSSTYIAVVYALRMLSMSFVSMPIQTHGLNSLTTDQTPHGTAINSTLNQVAGAIGTSLLISVMVSRTKTHMAAVASQVTDQTSQQHLMLQSSINGVNDAFLATLIVSGIAFILALFLKKKSFKAESEPDASDK
ncbi:MDR family MFS transporter [Lysinibacillus sp. NPDC096418]|uniref:MDR family MFS transporter n=1 Tax=Lysinibacillus sp. NPDC096418 TaxID=3364138 RepID=UPI0037F9B2C8